MLKTIKYLLLILGVLLLIPLWEVVIRFQAIGSFPFKLTRLTQYPVIGQYMPIMLFWLTCGLIVIILLCLIVIILWPSQKHQLVFKEDRGTLQIQEKAIENFANRIAQESGFLEEPKVKVRVTARRIKVHLEGSFNPQDVLPDVNQRFQENLKNKLSALLDAPKEKLRITLQFKNVYLAKHEHHRVE
ncbi:alkaline shock response membrane anchor protein AmaP [Oenococcus oeni]|uniref:Alkaline shock response membrane anchor protein AmaP n=2 Tax=Oenococcus oeni TaxID=1247 RepID=A0A6N4A4U5_OENOE|nr:alkaline shock response membrane anchor protein AmaP [Oenococcus oeni]KGH60015.1 hypothetical protein X288_02490 [Oenococcus oeni IOEB_9805]KGH75281.1 hypothetical protein X287_06195 [Oenococcus oeni IOEB_9803]KGH79009.1 hypothetical protein X285_00955 [Oenococcus oeni IOEB_9304]KGH79018.1 hypothetical protein X284_01825 [Oenococcus oeni IOEB_8417]KGH87453.1 hypothetical protein X292_01360 [Oenococcus oeni IOEB_C28]